jgi:hypothetical protein
MSAPAKAHPLAPELPYDRLRRWQRQAVIAGLVALVLAGIGAIFWPAAFFRAYLVAYLYWLGIALGCFVVVMIYHLTGGAWGFLVRRPLEAGMRTLPLLAVLFLPVAAGVRELFLWARTEEIQSAEEQNRSIYLNVPFFWARAAVCLAIWLVFSWLLTRWSRHQEESADPAPVRKLVLWSGPALVLYGITTMFASVDWVMSLQSAFHSTIIGPLVASGQMLTGFAWVLIVFACLVHRPPLSERVSPDAVADLGNLLFTFLIIWAYMGYFQFMLIWIANLPVDVIWYLPRTSGGWYWLVWLLFLFHFSLPFFLLLFKDVTRSPRALAWISALLLTTHLLYVEVMVLPVFPDLGLVDVAINILAPIGVGGLWVALYLRNLAAWPILAAHDGNEAAALELREYDAEKAVREEARHA